MGKRVLLKITKGKKERKRNRPICDIPDYLLIYKLLNIESWKLSKKTWKTHKGVCKHAKNGNIVISSSVSQEWLDNKGNRDMMMFVLTMPKIKQLETGREVEIDLSIPVKVFHQTEEPTKKGIDTLW
jgi:hypothetical protein